MQQSKPLERREEALELARRSCWDNVVRGRFKYLRVSVREGRVRVSCPTRISQRALTRFIEENLEKDINAEGLRKITSKYINRIRKMKIKMRKRTDYSRI